MSASTPLVSLVLVTYNSAALLPAFFGALATTHGPHYEVIAVDNASVDDTVAALARHGDVRLLANRENVGFGRACNQGARTARGELLVFLNADVLVTPEWLALLAARMAEHPRAGIISPQTVQSPHLRLLSLWERGTWGEGKNPVRETAAVPGCAMMVRRAAWEALGGFDERIFLYWEDAELCWRAWLRGWRVLEDLEATVVHERGGSGGGSRWAAEATRNGLYTHLKLLRPRAATPYLARQALKTAAALAQGRGRDLASAWAWNWRHLGETLAQRREIYRTVTGDPAHLERLIALHAARQRHERNRH